MNALFETELSTSFGKKTISVVAENIVNIEEKIDVFTTSAYKGDYEPVEFTVFSALYGMGIDVEALAKKPLIDLRYISNIWLSGETSHEYIRHVGCIETDIAFFDEGVQAQKEKRLINSIKAYFRMLDVATLSGVKIETVAMPLLGAGSQKISESLTLYPIINESIQFLKRNETVKRIYFIDRNQSHAFKLAKAVEGSYSLLHEKNLNNGVCEHGKGARAFISYSSPDRDIADKLTERLERCGVEVWYAPRNVHGPYAESIANAITGCTHFIVILSKNSLRSEHVLNEIDLAFKGLPERIKFKPLRIDTEELLPSFNYYLSRQHWMDAQRPPLEDRLDEFVNDFIHSL